ncbi:uncharacterized protein LOC135826343 isoform X2 [Sycon ciliatum]
MRNLSVRYSISSSPPTPASPTAVQESTAPISHAQSSAPNSPSQMPYKEEVVTQALGASTMPSTSTSPATPDYDNQFSLYNYAREDDATTTGYASSTAQNSNTVIAAANTTKPDPTPATGDNVSMATASATNPVIQSEEEAPAASLPGPECTEVVLPKKVVEPQRVLTNPNAENDGLASDQDSHDSPIRGTASPRNDDTPVEAYGKENKNFDQGSTEE